MKKGMILYVTGGRDDVFSGAGPDLDLLRRRLGVHRVHLAASEDDIAYGWWRMVVQGMQEVRCMRARFDSSEGKIEPEGLSIRLCG